MAQHLSEEEQIESLKRWWKDNGSQLIIMVVLVIGGWFGWQQWQDYRDTQAAQASSIYNTMMDLVGQESVAELNDDDKQGLRELSESLRTDHSASQYASYATMMLARMAATEKDFDQAALLLREVIDDSDDEALVDIVRTRLARVEIARKDYPAALAILDVEVPGAMTALFAELRGDIYYYQDDFAAARGAYQAALTSLSESGSSALPILKLKMNRVLDGGAGAADGLVKQAGDQEEPAAEPNSVSSKDES